MRAVRSLTGTALTLLVVGAVLVVICAYALPQVTVPGVDTTGLEARSLELVHAVLTAGGWLADRLQAILTGAWDGAVAGARS